MPKIARNNKQTANAKAVDVFKQALRALKIKPSDVLSHQEYKEKIVIVTQAGQKYVWGRSPNSKSAAKVEKGIR